jgi:hypothetical protein
MNYDLNCVHGPVTLSFEFLAVDNSADAVQISITLSYLPTDERLEWAIHEEWIAHRALSSFEQQLSSDGDAVLMGIRGEPLLRITEESGRALLEVGGTDADPGGIVESGFARIATRSGLKRSVERAFMEYAKWW